ncbi:MAG TPA: hypothetical protein VGH42_11325 [Verrucomicrobiae bacterium]|jgi:hypothetical protein
MFDEQAFPCMRAIGNRLFGQEWLVAGFLLLLAINNAVSDQFDHLTPRFSGTSVDLNAISYGTNVYVAVGEGGLILKSPDSATWSNQISPTTNELRGVVFANGMFVAVGGSGTIVTSPDGITWTAQISGVTNRLNAIGSSGGAFVAVGDSGTILYSTNAVNWKNIITGVPYNLNGIVGGFVIVGDSGAVLTSPDGLGWTVRSSGTFLGLNAVAHSFYGSFIAVGQSGVIITSPDGVTWTVHNSGVTTNFHSIAADPADNSYNTSSSGTFGVVGDGGIFLTSSNAGSNWISQPTETTNNLQGITFENGGFVAVGEFGSIEAGFVWVQRASGITNNLNSVAWGNNRFVAAGGQGIILTSTNGKDWTLCNSGTTDSLNVTFAGNKFMAFSSGSMVVSTNGVDWTAYVVFPSRTNIIAVAYGNGTFVMMADYSNPSMPGSSLNLALLSQDGINWTPSTTINASYAPLNDMAFGSNLFCAVGQQGNVYTSPDAVNWITHNIGQSAINYTVAYLNGRFIVSSQAGSLVTSTNGSDWVINGGNLGVFTGGRWCFGHNAFVAIGSLYDSFYETSSDGVTVSIRSPNSVSETPLSVSSVAFGAGTFVAVGASGLIVQSVPMLSMISALSVSQGIKINVTGDIGRNFVLETTTNLPANSWTSLFSVTNAPYSTNFIDVVTNVPQRFYRSHEL